MGYLNQKGVGFERWLDGAIKTYLETAASNFLSESVT